MVAYHKVEDRTNLKKKSVGFGGTDEDAFCESLSTEGVDIGINDRNILDKKNCSKSLCLSATGGQNNFSELGEDGRSYSKSETDPKLLIIANLFVQELLIRAAEEAKCRSEDETQVITPITFS